MKFIDSVADDQIRPHIFIGQARAKEGFDEVKYTRKHAPKGRKKVERLHRQEQEKFLEAERTKREANDKLERSARRTGSSEEAQISGMNQKMQKRLSIISKRVNIMFSFVHQLEKKVWISEKLI